MKVQKLPTLLGDTLAVFVEMETDETNDFSAVIKQLKKAFHQRKRILSASEL